MDKYHVDTCTYVQYQCIISTKTCAKRKRDVVIVSGASLRIKAVAWPRNMPLTAESVKCVLQKDAHLNPIHVQVEDISNNCGTSFSVFVVSAAFESKTLLARHRLIHAALSEQMPSIHALNIKCLTPDAYQSS